MIYLDLHSCVVLCVYFGRSSATQPWKHGSVFASEAIFDDKQLSPQHMLVIKKLGREGGRAGAARREH